MTSPSYTGTITGGHLVTERLVGCHPKWPDYPLLPGDHLFKRDDGRWGKFGPGLGIEGFELTPEQEAALEPIEGDRRYAIGGMDWFLSSD